MTRAERAKTCFISAPVGVHLQGLREALASLGVQVVQDAPAFVSDLTSEIRKQISKADLVIGVFTEGQNSPWVLFELGLAIGLGRRAVLIAKRGDQTLPSALPDLVVLRVDLSNREALIFALSQLLAAPQRRAKHSVTKTTLGHGLGATVDDLLAELDASLQTREPQAIEKLVGKVLDRSGATAVAESVTRDRGADFAVWSDALGGPLLVEVKTRVPSVSAARLSLRELSARLESSGAPWGLLLYADGPEMTIEDQEGIPPYLAIVSLRKLIESLRASTLPEIILTLRNARVHGDQA